MKLGYIYTLFVIGIIAFLSLANAGGRATVAGWGNTGAPGDQTQTCITCHGSSASVQMTVDLGIEDAGGNAITSGMYTPGETYSMTVTMNTVMGSPSAFGFQMLCLNAEMDQDGPESSNYSNASSNAQIAAASNTNRVYVEQNAASASNEFSVDWQAPAAGSGAVTFYVCGNGVNGNGATSGDGAACTKVQLDEDGSSGTTSLTGINDITIAPNPSNGNFNLKLNSSIQESAEIRITDITGKSVYNEVINVVPGEMNKSISFDAPTSGMYIMQFATDKGQHTEKLVIR